MSKRHTALLLGLLPVVVIGLNACTTSSGRPQVQDLSVSRNSETNSTYTVKGGDTIYGIAWQNRVDFRDLAQLNGISPPYRLEPGQQLKLKSGASVSNAQTVASSGGVTATGLDASGSTQSAAAEGDNPSWLLPSDGETPSSGGTSSSGQATNVASSSVPTGSNSGGQGDSQGQSRTVAQNGSQNASQQGSSAAPADTGSSSSSASINRGSTKTAAGNDAGTEVAGEPSGAPDRSDRTYKPVENVPWQWPTSGQVVGKFDGDSNITPGIDIAGQKGQPVKAAGPGIVVYAGDGVRGYGNLIILKHNDRFLSAYAHNDSLKVKENDVVETGETIATMGQTDADQVELHFEVRVNGQPQDPLKYLPAR
ncbi:peptidoglycan DD-metalloendopeptidase family protein [Salinicola halophyticus]|uniref:peptidoglycan DD-metalloendopeptidase family protein n=1 Tax=Salinicola halophyticus TaxID=1808881 RepID=UPI003F44E139